VKRSPAISSAQARYRAGRDLAVDLRRRDDAGTAHGGTLAGQHFLLNHPNDTVYRNNDSFPSDRVLTMFTQQWVGIRQACGALSGHKLALDGHHAFDAVEIGQIASHLRDLKIDQVVYHGMAHSTAAVLRGLKTLLPAVTFYGVWHGTMAGWTSREEVTLFREFLGLADDKVYDRIGFLRQGMQNLHPRAFSEILYNIPPKVDLQRSRLPFTTRPINCIFPSWDNSWKNMYTNLLGAQCSPIVGDVFVYSQPQLDLFDKVHVVPFGGHDAHYRRVARMDICLNVSINDCQPMAELESLSVGTPSLRNDWNLGLETHSPYEDIFTVSSYLNAGAITDKLRELVEMDPQHLSQVTATHRSILIDASRKRYSGFLGG
jgi:hypothetical protein